MKTIKIIKETILFSSIMFGIVVTNGYSQSTNPNPYMGDKVELREAPNGAIARKELLTRIGDAAWLEPTIERPAENIYVFGGYAVAPISMIETEDGLIVFDTGDAKHDGEILLDAIRTVSDKPIKAIIYGHSHTVHGAGVLAEGNDDVITIGKKGLNEKIALDQSSSGLPAFYPEIGPYLMARAVSQFNGYMPDKGADAWAAPINIGAPESTFIPVNTPVEDGQELTVLGVKMQFFTKYGSDDKYHTTVWLPESKTLLTTMLWSSPPQLYTLRGDLFRDPKEWISGLRFNMGLKPEVLVSAAAKPIVGGKNIQKALQDYMDGTMFVLDQSLRGILQGKGPDELRHSVVFPDYLYESPSNLQSYGEISTYAPAIFYHAVGWWDGDAANIKELAPAHEAVRWVKMVGGQDAMLKEAQKAFDKKEYAWAAKLANQVYIISSDHKEARQLKADALRQMAYRNTGATDRAHLLSQALELEGKIKIHRLIPPSQEAVANNPTLFVDYFRVRIDPKKSGEITKFIRFEFTDGTTAGLHVRRAIAEFYPNPETYDKKADITLELSPETWYKLYINNSLISKLIADGEVTVKGNEQEAIKVLNLFDTF